MIRDLKRNRKRWAVYESQRTRTKNAIKIYVRMMLSGKIDWNLVSNAYRKNQKNPIATFKRLIKQEEIKQMINQELSTLLSDNGIDQQFVVTKIKEALTIAEEKKDVSNMLKALENIQELLGMMPDKVKMITTNSFTGHSSLFDSYNKAKEEQAKITGKVTIEKQLIE